MIYIPPLEEEVDSTATAVEDGGVQNISRIKIYRTQIFSKSICNIFLLLKRRWLRKTKFFEDGGVLFSVHPHLQCGCFEYKHL